jgi:hypothetical protein
MDGGIEFTKGYKERDIEIRKKEGFFHRTPLFFFSFLCWRGRTRKEE